MSSFAPAPVTCSNGHIIDPWSVFCSTCGQPAVVNEREGFALAAPRVRAACPNGHAVEPHTAYCSACGSPTVQVVDPTDSAWGHPGSTASVAGSSGHRAQRPPRRRGLWIAAGVVAALVLGGGATALTVVLTAVDTTTVQGTFELYDDDTASAGCVGYGGYGDIEPGTVVVLSDEKGTVLGSGDLGEGLAMNGVCTYGFTIADVRENAEQYVFEVADRGKVINTRAEMVSNDWSTGLTLGA